MGHHAGMVGVVHGDVRASCEDWERGLWVPCVGYFGSQAQPFGQAFVVADLEVPYGDCEDWLVLDSYEALDVRGGSG